MTNQIAIFVKFQLTHPSRGATTVYQVCGLKYSISTHTPLAGCDVVTHTANTRIINFNSHTPCGVRLSLFQRVSGFNDFNSHTPCGVRHEDSQLDRRHGIFQLTHPLRGATILPIVRPFSSIYFNSHTPCGVRHERNGVSARRWNFNSHTPCGVRQQDGVVCLMNDRISTHTPLAGCDHNLYTHVYYEYISTHTPLAGCDPRIRRCKGSDKHFNSHTPRGVRQQDGVVCLMNDRISTHTPLAGCDHNLYTHVYYEYISTHTPLAGCDF